MRSSFSRAAVPTAALAAAALLAGPASAGSSRPPAGERARGAGSATRPAAPAASRTTAPCAPAAIADVLLAAPVPVDEIRVVVRGEAPNAAAEVTVESGPLDRVLHVRGGSHSLSFHPALTSSAFRVSLLPSLEAAASPCVDRIELRGGGAAVATVVP